MGGQAPGGVGFEHRILQDKIFGICPVIGDLPGIVPAHHIGSGSPGTARGTRILAGQLGGAVRGNKAVHLSGVNILGGRSRGVRPAGINIAGVMVGLNALPGEGIWRANGGYAVLHGEAVGAGKGAKVLVEGAVLLHDDDNMLDL